MAENLEISSKQPLQTTQAPVKAAPALAMASNAPSTISGTSDALEEDMEDMDIQDMEELIGPSMSRQATRLRSPRTPAIEKRNALEEALAYFEDGPNTPPITDGSTTMDAEHISHKDITTDPVLEPRMQASEGEDNPIGGPPLPKQQYPGFSHHQPGPPQPSLHVVFGNDGGHGERKRSFSGSTAALKNLLPKGLPSMAQVGNMFSSGSSSQKTKSGWPSSPPKSPNFVAQSTSGTSTPHAPVHNRNLAVGAVRPQSIRRSTSDDSLLYHSLSRSSSLGNDLLFENQRQQVNSRAKAIKDSFQDRSSFRMPNIPSMPTIPSFNFSLNFLNSSDAPAKATSRPRSNTEGIGIMPSNIIKKLPLPVSTPAVKPGIIATPAAAPEAQDSVKSASERIKHLDRAIEGLTGDVVIMGGYRGSVLRSTKNQRQVWAPVKVGLNIRKVDLEVGLNPEDEARMHETIYPDGMLQSIGPVDISRRLFKKLRDCENSVNGTLRVWDYGYDWRLSPALLAKRLSTFLEKLPCNRPQKDGSPKPNRGALVIAHSLGGLITRRVVNSRPDLFSGVIYAGVPQSCINILGPLRNGDAVLLSQRVLTAQVNFTLRTSFLLLPEDGSCFVDIRTRERYPMDFFDVNTWIKYRLSPCIDPPLPPRLPPSGILNNLNISSSMLNLPLAGKKSSPPISTANSSIDLQASGSEQHHRTKTTRAADALRDLDHGTDRTLAPQMGNKPNSVTKAHSNSVSMVVTIPRDKAIAYLTRTLAEIKKFKEELHFRPELSEANAYPPMALIYGKSMPTCCGAKVDGLEGIPCSDVYDNLAFAAGDGVTLAKEAMLPEGYKVAYGGRIRSDRGHLTLLGDLDAVGKAIEAVTKGRAKGIGIGV